MSYSFEGLAPQGWQCPICRRVYSPTTPMCYYCGNGVVTTTTTTNIETPKTEEDFTEKWKKAIKGSSEYGTYLDALENLKNERNDSKSRR